MLRATTLTFAAGLALPATAQTLTWNNPAGGSAAVAGNWAPAGIPNAANPLLWNLSATYPVTFTAGTAASLSQTFRHGRVTLTMPTHSTGPLTISDSAADDAIVILAGGTWNVAGLVAMGRPVGSVGTLTINDSDADLVHTSTFFVVGDRGTGALNLTGGGRLNTAGRFQVAANIGSTGAVVVDGGRIAPPIRRSTLEAQDDAVIGSGGSGSLLVDRGALASFGADVRIASGHASIASVTVEDSGLVDSRMSIAGELFLGANASAGSAGGSGTLTVNTTGQVQVGGTIHVGDDPDGGSGLVRVTGADSTVTCAGLVLGSGGSFDLQDGAFTIDHGPMTTPLGSVLSLRGSGGSSLLTLRQQAAAEVTHLQIAVDGRLSARVESGSTLDARGTLAVGINSGAEGWLTVTGAGSRATAASLRVGSETAGFLVVEAGGLVRSQGRCEVGALPGSAGVLSISSADAQIVGRLYVACRDNGAGGAGAGGVGLVTVGSHGTLSCDRLDVSSLGQFTVDRGLATVAGHAFITGSFTVSGGTFRADSMEAYGSFRASGSVLARVFSSQVIEATGPLTLGDGTLGAIERAPLVIGPHTVTLQDAGPVQMASSTIDGGTLISASGFTLPSTLFVQGTGRVVGDFRDEGSVIPTGPEGLSFAGTFTHPGGALISGTRIHFEPTARYIGHTSSGNVRWHSDPGSVLVFDATSSVGLNVADGFECGGELDITGSLFVGDSNGISCGTTCTLRDGVLFFNGFTTVGRTGNTRHVLRGTGGVPAGLTNIGAVSPGLAEGDRTGTLNFGVYRQTDGFTTGQLEIDIDGPAADQADKVHVAQGALLDGSLILRVSPGFIAPNGFRRTVLEAGSISGAFSRVEAPPGWHVEQTAAGIDAVFCVADFNADSFVDFFDYDDFVACFETGVCPPGTTADFNRDGFADFFDYDDFVLAFEQGC